MTKKKENVAKVTLRIPRDLLAKVKELADKERRSSNFMFVELVEAGIKKESEQSDVPPALSLG